MGLVCLAVGVTGSSLGKREQAFTLTEGQAVEWAGRKIRVARVNQRKLPDKLVGEAVLEISRSGRLEATLVPAQHYHPLQDAWTAEVAIQSTWAGDFYAILHGGTAEGQLDLTFRENPLMRWLWLGGAVMVLGTAVRLWPRWRNSSRQPGDETAGEKRQEEPLPNRRVVPPPLSRVRERRLRAPAETVRMPAGGKRPDPEEIGPQ
jgi:cytochrome c-type biogenesis protein CcmF